MRPAHSLNYYTLLHNKIGRKRQDELTVSEFMKAAREIRDKTGLVTVIVKGRPQVQKDGDV